MQKDATAPRRKITHAEIVHSYRGVSDQVATLIEDKTNVAHAVRVLHWARRSFASVIGRRWVAMLAECANSLPLAYLMPTLHAGKRQSYFCLVDEIESFVPATLSSAIFIGPVPVAATGIDLPFESICVLSDVNLASLAVSFLSLLLA